MSDCANFIHEWVDHYYGVECKNCKLMITMPNARAIESPVLAKANLVIDAEGKRAKNNPRSVPSRDRVAARAQGQAELKRNELG